MGRVKNINLLLNTNSTVKGEFDNDTKQLSITTIGNSAKECLLGVSKGDSLIFHTKDDKDGSDINGKMILTPLNQYVKGSIYHHFVFQVDKVGVLTYIEVDNL